MGPRQGAGSIRALEKEPSRVVSPSEQTGLQLSLVGCRCSIERRTRSTYERTSSPPDRASEIICRLMLPTRTACRAGSPECRPQGPASPAGIAASRALRRRAGPGARRLASPASLSTAPSSQMPSRMRRGRRAAAPARSPRVVGRGEFWPASSGRYGRIIIAIMFLWRPSPRAHTWFRAEGLGHLEHLEASVECSVEPPRNTSGLGRHVFNTLAP